MRQYHASAFKSTIKPVCGSHREEKEDTQSSSLRRTPSSGRLFIISFFVLLCRVLLFSDVFTPSHPIRNLIEEGTNYLWVQEQRAKPCFRRPFNRFPVASHFKDARLCPYIIAYFQFCHHVGFVIALIHKRLSFRLGQLLWGKGIHRHKAYPICIITAPRL